MKHQRGNILFLILLAIILFVALTYAVNSGMRGGGRDGSKESVQAQATAVLQYMTLVRSSVQRLMLSNGCTYDNLDWRTAKYLRVNGTVLDSTSQPATNPKTGCAVFSDFGGPVTPQTFEQYEVPGFTTYFATANPTMWKPGHFGFRWASRINEGTDASDVIMGGAGFPNALCAYLLNPASPPTTLPTEAWDSSTLANLAPPALITGGNRIGDDPLNLNGDVFVQTTTVGSITYCGVSMILLSR